MVLGSGMLVNDAVNKVWLAWQADVISRDLLDFLFVMTAVVFNLQVIGVYVSSKNGRMKIARRFGVMMLFLAFPLAIVFAGYYMMGEEIWSMIGLSVIFLYLLVELVLDFILKIEFRKMPLLHIPYIILFYVVQAALIGIAFSIDTVWGWLVSITFWALLAALVYSLWPRKQEAIWGE